MPDRVFVLTRTSVSVLTALLLGIGSAAQAEKERCVAGPDGQWRCGKNVTDADAAPLPAKSQRSAPPMMLIDPRRFGEADRAPPPEPVRQEASAAAQPSTPAAASDTGEVQTEARSEPVASVEPVSTPEPVAQSKNTEAPAQNLDFSAPTTGFAVQLAVASSPRGFGALLAKLGSRPSNFQQRQLRGGNWVLLLGNFPTLEAARAAIPSAVPGAFARNLADLSFN